MTTPALVEDYVRNAVVVDVTDGDTITILLDLGLNLVARRRVRVLGVNCPEMHGPTAVAGAAAKRATTDWLARAPEGRVIVKTYLADKTDSFGRILAEVWIGNESLTDYLLVNGYAVPFKG